MTVFSGIFFRPELIDRALLRPGRFEELLYIPLPSPQERGLILRALARKRPIDTNVDLIEIAERTACDNFSGADVACLVCSYIPFPSFIVFLSWLWTREISCGRSLEYRSCSGLG